MAPPETIIMFVYQTHHQLLAKMHFCLLQLPPEVKWRIIFSASSEWGPESMLQVWFLLGFVFGLVWIYGLFSIIVSICYISTS